MCQFLITFINFIGQHVFHLLKPKQRGANQSVSSSAVPPPAHLNSAPKTVLLSAGLRRTPFLLPPPPGCSVQLPLPFRTLRWSQNIMALTSCTGLPPTPPTPQSEAVFWLSPGPPPAAVPLPVHGPQQSSPLGWCPTLTLDMSHHHGPVSWSWDCAWPWLPG